MTHASQFQAWPPSEHPRLHVHDATSITAMSHEQPSEHATSATRHADTRRNDLIDTPADDILKEHKAFAAPLCSKSYGHR